MRAQKSYNPSNMLQSGKYPQYGSVGVSHEYDISTLRVTDCHMMYSTELGPLRDGCFRFPCLSELGIRVEGAWRVASHMLHCHSLEPVNSLCTDNYPLKRLDHHFDVLYNHLRCCSPQALNILKRFIYTVYNLCSCVRII